jgi:putative ABC transport system permease protein
MASKGQMVGFDLDDAAYIPVATAMGIFALDELTEIDVLATSTDAVAAMVEGLRRMLKERHRGQEDFTITSQAEMLETSGRVIGMITAAVTAIAAISLLVGAIGILTILWISVHERTQEVGLLRALGVTPGEIGRLFLVEAAMIAAAGGLVGVTAGLAIGGLLRLLVPALPLSPSVWAIAAALAMSLVVGLASGWLPARRAAALDPVDALRAE